MSGLIKRIQAEKVRTAEDMVLADLEELGIISNIGESKIEKHEKRIAELEEAIKTVYDGWVKLGWGYSKTEFYLFKRLLEDK